MGIDRARTNVFDRFHCVYKYKRAVLQEPPPFGLQIHVLTSSPQLLALKTYEPLFLELLIPLTGVNLAKRLASSDSLSAFCLIATVQNLWRCMS